jgi:hypothetical protein
MLIKNSDLRSIDPHEVLYALYVYGPINELDVMAFINACRRLQRKYPNVSWFAAVSRHESKSTKKVRKKNGLRGRPKTMIIGNTAPLHMHLGAVGINGASAYSFERDLKKFVNKRLCGRRSTFSSKKGMDFIAYSFDQASSFYSGGPYKFKQCFERTFFE